ncbi:coiled-coil domain-containing protein 9 isoform X2 [Narcine bancroftii]
MSAAVNLKSREEQDAELDRKIEALRKKNEALMRRHQEIEEDRKKAEEDGISVTSRRPKYEAEHERRHDGKGLPTQAGALSKSPPDRRAANDGKPRSNLGRQGRAGGPSSPGPMHVVDQGVPCSSPRHRPDRALREDRTERSPQGFSGHEGGAGERRGRGRRGHGSRGGIDRGGVPTGAPSQDRRVKEWEEKRRQNIEKMNKEMEKIAEYERGQMTGAGEKNPTRNFLDDPRRSGSLPDNDRKDGSRRHVRNWGGPDFDKVKTGLDRGKNHQGRHSGPKAPFDMTLSMTGRERAEYMRWKKEREQIDQERLARHRNATGQWRREWDAEKTESILLRNTQTQSLDTPNGLRGVMRSGDWCQNQTSREGQNTEMLEELSRPRSDRRRFKERSHPTEDDSFRDDQRPPKPPMISDFIFQSKSKDAKRGRVKYRESNYSMHDNRWETPEAEREKEQEKELEAQLVRDPEVIESRVDEDKSPEDDFDDDEWEDASDSEEEIVGEEVSDEEEVVVVPNEGKKKEEIGTKEPADMQSTDQGPEGGAKEQRVRKGLETLHIAPKEAAGEPAETEAKPLSPFSLDGYHPVKDWAEEMEITSPRTSVVQNPLQSARLSQEECPANVALGSEGTPTNCKSQTGQEPRATVDPDGVPASDDVATIEAEQVVEQEGSRTEMQGEAGEILEAPSGTSQSRDCMEESERISG